MSRHEVNAEAVRRSAVRSTQASAQLERRSVPAEYERPARVVQFLAERHQRDR